MELFIRTKDGQPFEHPIFGDNFCAAFPHIDTNNLPEGFARFERKEPTPVGLYEVDEGVTYELVDGVYTDVFHRRAMTDEERVAKQNQTKSEWTATGFTSWIFDEQTCSFKPPVAMPQDGKRYTWDEATTNWIEVTNA